MTKEWYCRINGIPYGPFAADELRQLAVQGRIQPDSEVRYKAEGVWFKAEALSDLFPSDAAAPSPALPTSQSQQPPQRRPGAKLAAPAPAMPARSPLARAMDEDPELLESLVSSETSSHASERAWSKRHRKKPDNSILFVIVPVCIAILIGGVLFLTMRQGSDTGPGAERLDEMLARRAQAEKAASKGAEPMVAPQPEKPAKVDWAKEFDVSDSPKPTSAKPEPKSEEKSQSKPASKPDVKPRPDDNKWYDASKEGAWCGDATVKVVLAEVAPPKVISQHSGAEGRGKEIMLLLTLEIRSNVQDRSLQYTSWSVGGRDFETLKLTDNLSRPYLPKFKKAFVGYTLDGQLKKATIAAGEAIEDVLAFQQPRLEPKVKFLRLELPAVAFGEKGTVRIEIPVSMIKVKQEAMPGDPSRPKANPKSDFGLDGNTDDATAPPPRDDNPADPEAVPPPLPDGDELEELQRDESDLIIKREQREAAEKAAAEEAKKREKKPPANEAEGLFRKR